MSPEDIEALRAKLTRIQQAEKVTLMLAKRSGAQPDYEWRPEPRPYCSMYDRREYAGKIIRTHRDPPLPFHAKAHGPGTCRICGQPIYGGGGHLKKNGPPHSRLTWHKACTISYFVMIKPSDYIAPLVLLQNMRCPLSGRDLSLPSPAGQYLEVDHDIPLFRVARDHADRPWFELIKYWMTGNLRAITREAHLAKCAAEARERADYRKVDVAQGAML